VSDHRPFAFHLVPVAPDGFGRGLPRVRMHFVRHSRLREQFRDAVDEMVAAAPADPHALLALLLDGYT
jgi:hypothetical protein